MDQETLNLINKYRQYNPEYEKYTDQEITQLGLPGLDQSDNTQDGNKFNFMDYLPFGNKSTSGSIMRGIGQYMPDMDPRQKNLNQFYDVNNGTIQSGLMKDYNPVSGGFLNTITGGKFGDPTKYGLQDAYQKRIDTINKTLQRKYTKKGISFDNTELDERRDQLIADMNNESNAMSGGGDGTFGLGTQGQKSYSNPGDTFGTNAITGGPVSNKTGKGRTDYFFGGRARLQGGGGADMGAPEKAAERTSRGYGTAPDTGSKSGTNDYSTATQDRNHDRAMRDYQIEKPSTLDNAMNLGSELSYLNNLKNLNVPGIALNFGINKLRNYLDNRKTTEEEDRLSYNTNTLPTDNYFTEVQQKDLDASKMRGFKKQDYNSYLNQMNMLNDGTKVTPYEFQGLQDGSITTTGTFTAANGGRAMFKNGGLASIL